MLLAFAAMSWSPALAGALVVTYIVGLVALNQLTHTLRDRSRRVEMVTIVGPGGVTEHGEAELFTTARADLEVLEARLAQGELTPVEFESGWTCVYNRLDSR